jgi:hypothetical protein
MLTEPDVGCPLRFEIQGVDLAAEFSDPGIGKRYTDPRPAYSGVGGVRSMNALPDPCDRGGVKSPGVLPDCELVLVPSLLRLEGLDAHTVQIRGQRHPMAVEFEGQTDRPADFAVELQIQFYVVQDHPGVDRLGVALRAPPRIRCSYQVSFEEVSRGDRRRHGAPQSFCGRDAVLRYRGRRC